MEDYYPTEVHSNLFLTLSTSLTGPGFFTGWLLTLVAVLISWTQNDAFSKRILYPMLPLQAYPMVLSTALVWVIWHVLPSFSAPRRDEDIEPVRHDSFETHLFVYMWACLLGCSFQGPLAVFAARRKASTVIRTHWAVFGYLSTCLTFVILSVIVKSSVTLSGISFWTWLSILVDIIAAYEACKIGFKNTFCNEYKTQEDWISSVAWLLVASAFAFILAIISTVMSLSTTASQAVIAWYLSPMNPAIWKLDQINAAAFGIAIVLLVAFFPSGHGRTAQDMGMLPTSDHGISTSLSTKKPR